MEAVNDLIRTASPNILLLQGMKIDGHHTEVSYKFAQGLDNDIVTVDTLKIELTRELIAEVTGIPDEGEYWFKKVPFTFNS